MRAPVPLPSGFSFEWTDLSYQQATSANAGLCATMAPPRAGPATRVAVSCRGHGSAAVDLVTALKGKDPGTLGAIKSTMFASVTAALRGTA